MKIKFSRSTSSKMVARLKNKAKIRKKVHGTKERPRLAVYRSLSHTYAQLIDDTTGQVLMATSTLKMKTGDNSAKSKETAKVLGSELGKLALSKNITKVVFDRSGYLYHGRVQAVAEGAREAGLNF